MIDNLGTTAKAFEYRPLRGIAGLLQDGAPPRLIALGADFMCRRLISVYRQIQICTGPAPKVRKLVAALYLLPLLPFTQLVAKLLGLALQLTVFVLECRNTRLKVEKLLVEAEGQAVELKGLGGHGRVAAGTDHRHGKIDNGLDA